MAIPVLKATVNDLRDYYNNYPSCDVFESFDCGGYSVEDIEIIISKEAADEYSQWIYENLK